MTTLENPTDWTQRFEQRRPYLRSLAFRMLGSLPEAEDALQETWLRFDRTDKAQMENWEGWVVTVLTRICLDALRRRRRCVEQRVDSEEDLARAVSRVLSPEQEAELAEAVGAALLVVLNTLAPPERLAFVLHDMFGFAFEEIASVLEKSPAAVRQIASRARKKVQGARHASPRDLKDKEVVSSFLAYLRAGDVNGIMSVLHPEVVRQADAAAVPPTDELILVGRARVAEEAAKNRLRAQIAQTAWVNGQIGIVVAPRGQLRVALLCSVVDDKIVRFDVIAEPERLMTLEIGIV